MCGWRWAKGARVNRTACARCTTVRPGASLYSLLELLLLRLALESLSLGSLSRLRRRPRNRSQPPLQGSLLQALASLKMPLLELLEPEPVLQAALLSRWQLAKSPTIRLLIPLKPDRFLLLISL